MMRLGDMNVLLPQILEADIVKCAVYIDEVEMREMPHVRQAVMVVRRSYRRAKDYLDRQEPSPRLALVRALQGGCEL